MTKICTSTIFDKRTLPVADAIVENVNRMRRYWPLTIRQVFYLLVSAMTIPNSLKQYKRVSRIGVTLRENEIIPWDAIEDRTRRTTLKRGLSDVQEFLDREIKSFCDPMHYQRCYIQDQDVHVEVTTEKDALSSILERVTYWYCTRLSVIRGQASATIVEKIAQRYEQAAMLGKRLVMLHMGDLDPSGVAIPKAVKRNLLGRHGLDVEMIRVGLNPSQVIEHGLPTSIDAVKPKDPNLQTWLKEYGPDQPAVELDALPPETLTKILEDALQGVYYMGGIDAQKQKEIEEREILETLRHDVIGYIASNYPELV